MRKCRKRKQTFEGELDEYYERARRRFKANDSVEEEFEYLGNLLESVEQIIHSNRGFVGPRRPNRNREVEKLWWHNAYQNWDDEQFKEKFRINKETFDFVLNIIRQFIEKTPTNLVPNPIEPDRQLGLTLYRLAHGCSFVVMSDLFGVSKSLATKTFNHVVRELVVHLYNDYVKMLESEQE